MDTAHMEIQNLFFEHMKKLSIKAHKESFDVQFSDRWI